MKSTNTRKFLATRAVLSAAVLATAAGAMALTTPIANADQSDLCAISGGTYARSAQGKDNRVVESCTTTDKGGNKTTCSWVNGAPQGCVQVPKTQPDQSHPLINITPQQLGTLPDTR